MAMLPADVLRMTHFLNTLFSMTRLALSWGRVQRLGSNFSMDLICGQSSRKVTGSRIIMAEVTRCCDNLTRKMYTIQSRLYRFQHVLIPSQVSRRVLVLDWTLRFVLHLMFFDSISSFVLFLLFAIA
jgi:hypothetical protein